MTDAQELDPITVRIGEAIELGQRGLEEVAVKRLADLWAEVGGEPPPVEPHSSCFQHAHADHPHN